MQELLNENFMQLITKSKNTQNEKAVKQLKNVLTLHYNTAYRTVCQRVHLKKM